MPLRNRNVLSLQRSEPRNIWKMMINLLTTTDGDKYSNYLAVTYFLDDLLTKNRKINKEGNSIETGFPLICPSM